MRPFSFHAGFEANALDARAGNPFHRRESGNIASRGAEHMDDDRREELRETFATFDNDRSGAIGFEEFYAWWTDQ